MKDKKIRILSTRPLDETLINKALKHRIIIDSISFIETDDIIDNYVLEEIKQIGSKPVTVVFTSMNGAKAVIKQLQKYSLQPPWKLYCIGTATQFLIKDFFGDGNVAATGKNALELSEEIIHDNVKEVVFFCGDQRRDELPEHLKKNNIRVKEIVVYKTNEIPVKVHKKYQGILFFSPSAVKSFFSVNSIPSDTVLFSIGNTTADAIKKICSNTIIISDFPSKEKLTEEAIAYFDTINKSNA